MTYQRAPNPNGVVSLHVHVAISMFLRRFSSAGRFLDVSGTRFAPYLYRPYQCTPNVVSMLRPLFFLAGRFLDVSGISVRILNIRYQNSVRVRILRHHAQHSKRASQGHQFSDLGIYVWIFWFYYYPYCVLCLLLL